MSHIRKTAILCIILHIYIALSALVFQRCEYREDVTITSKLTEMTLRLANVFNVTEARASSMVQEILLARMEDLSHDMTKSWNNFASSIWFVMTLFTTVGTGHIVPQTFSGRLFCMISSLFGIPLYALFLKHAGDHIINILRHFIILFEAVFFHREASNIKHMNIKILVSAFLLMTTIILIGALGSFAFEWTYFEGIYFCFISLSTVGFGDLVPKIDKSTEMKVFSCLYMIFNIIGLAIVSCFISSLVNSMEDINILWNKFKEGLFPSSLFAPNNVGSETGNGIRSGIVQEQEKI